jgi:hypothetical protein
MMSVHADAEDAETRSGQLDAEERKGIPCQVCGKSPAIARWGRSHREKLEDIPHFCFDHHPGWGGR